MIYQDHAIIAQFNCNAKAMNLYKNEKRLSFKLFCEERTSCTWVKVLTILAVIYSILTYLLHRLG